MTWLEVCKDEAKKAGVELTDKQADTVLWEFTGFPSFFDGDPEECVRRQVREWANSHE